MKVSDFKTPGLCACGKEGRYPRTNGQQEKVYWRCKECHANAMRVYMRRVYATPEGRAAANAANRRWYAKHKAKKDRA